MKTLINRIKLPMTLLLFVLLCLAAGPCGMEKESQNDCDSDERCYYESSEGVYYSRNPEEDPCPCAEF